MASKKEVSLDREPQPEIESFDDASSTFRTDTCKVYDEKFPDVVHTWQAPEPSVRTLRMKGQEVVNDENGEPIRDALGDVLVRQSRERWEKKRKMESDMSLESVAATIGSASEDEGMVEVDADLIQFANPRKKKAPITKVKLTTG